MPTFLDEVIRLLRARPFIHSSRIIEYDETPFGTLLLKIRCRLPAGHQLQIWIHQEPEFLAYSYQLFTDRPLLRWDNAPHHPELQEHFPHHFHDQSGNVTPSDLRGDVLVDLPAILDRIQGFLTGR